MEDVKARSCAVRRLTRGLNVCLITATEAGKQSRHFYIELQSCNTYQTARDSLST